MNAMTVDKGFPPPLFYARIVDRLNSENKVAALQEISSWYSDFPAPNLVLFDEDGHVIYPKGKQELVNWGKLTKPLEDYSFIYVPPKNENKRPMGVFRPPGPPMHDALVKLRGTPTQYLLIGFPEKRGPPGDARPFIPLIGLASLVLSLLLGVGTTITVVYNSVRKGVIQADHVISELHNGNLKARFEVTRKDEFGQAMLRFNIMADEIEKLVWNLKTVDQSRTRLLQELAHDLRTPIASLKSLIETLDSRSGTLKVEVQNEMTTLALKEINYFERLVEDLLFLAQVKEPAYQPTDPLINISSILSETVDDFSVRPQKGAQKIELRTHIENPSIEMHGDAHLIRRLLRNAFENAYGFASSSVLVSLQKIPQDKIEISIEDDGPGFTPEALNAFGHRRVTRQLENKPDGRLSVGLGSVVMKTICEAYKGQIEATNRIEDSKVLGARIKITLPTG